MRARLSVSEKQEKGGIDFNWKNNFFSCHFFRAFKSFVSLTRKEEKWMKNCSTNSSHFSGSTLDQCDAATRTNYARRKLFLWKHFAGSTLRVLLLKNMKNCWWNWKSWKLSLAVEAIDYSIMWYLFSKLFSLIEMCFNSTLFNLTRTQFTHNNWERVLSSPWVRLKIKFTAATISGIWSSTRERRTRKSSEFITIRPTDPYCWDNRSASISIVEKSGAVSFSRERVLSRSL